MTVAETPEHHQASTAVDANTFTPATYTVPAAVMHASVPAAPGFVRVEHFDVNGHLRLSQQGGIFLHAVDTTLEQLRALEAGMRIDFTIVDTVPRGVDTPADLETARGILSKS